MTQVLRLKKSNCKNCYKCIRHCPVKSIRFSGNQAHVESEACVLCGQCFVHCPQDAKEIIDGLETTRVLIQSGAPVIASVAPSFAANYRGSGIEDIRAALLKLGFADAEETALGATIVKREYEKLMERDPDVLITSCCHSVNLLIQKYYPKALPFLAPVITPMEAHARDIKRRNPEAKTVFIGPCLAKKDECEHSDAVDAALTFEELSAWLRDAKVTLTQTAKPEPKSRARFFPTSGGIIKTMRTDETKHTYLTVDGVEKCVAALRDIESGGLRHCFIEMSACAGSCVGGPIMEKNGTAPISNYIAITNIAGGDDFEIETQTATVKAYEAIEHAERNPSEDELRAILKRMGKTSPKDMLDCGTCGYDTCRDKAVAVYRGKAEISMCLPFLMNRAEAFSDIILRNTPNGIMVLNESLEVQQINIAAMRLMSISQQDEILGEHVVRILDPAPFYDCLENGRNSFAKKVYLSEYDKYAEQTVIYSREDHAIVCILRDITEKTQLREQKEQAKLATTEVADKVVAKQMEIVQQIAALLGETAAETKIALTKLKESI